MGEKKSKLSVLVIDDNADFREIVSAKLEAAGFVVEQAENGHKGLEKASETPPDLILLDIEMPNMSGVQFLRKMKDDSSLAHLKVAFLTNHGESSSDSAWLDKKFASEIGVSGYIRKSDDLDKIVQEIQTLTSG